MEMKEFGVKVQKALIKKLGAAYDIRLQEVRKNNGVTLLGILILAKDQNVSPTIYLNSFWEAYENGVTFTAVIERILQIYEEDTPKENVNMEFFRDFGQVKERICYRLISREKNGELLEKIPHMEYLDMAICFYYAYQGDLLGAGSILIYNNHLKMWNTTTEELFTIAQENTPILFPWEMTPLADTVQDMMECGEEQENEYGEFLSALPMQVLTNECKIHGAVCVLYPDLLRKLSEEAGKNFYVIPCSIHEVILLPDSGAENGAQLQEIIKEVNRTQVDPEEVLSDNLYYYNRFSDRLNIF